jgi:predicted PurR-regulated permease PerM
MPKKPHGSLAQVLLFNAFMASARFQFAILLALGAVALVFFGPFLVPVAAGLVFTSLLLPLHKKLEKRNWKPFAASFVLTFGFTTLVLLPAGIVIGAGANQLATSVRSGAGGASAPALQKATQPHSLSQTLVDSRSARFLLQKVRVDPKDARVWLEDHLKGIQERISQALGNILSRIPGAFFSGLIALGTVFFMLAEHDKAWNFCLKYLPLSFRAATDLSRSFMQVSRSVFLGYVISGICQGSVQLTGSLIAGKGSPLLIGLATFILAFVPVLGTAPLSVALTFWQAFQGNWGATAVFSVFGLLTATVDNLVVPWFVGKENEIHPLLVFISAFGAIPFCGPWGLFLGPIFTYLFIHSLQSWSTQRSEAASVQSLRPPSENLSA